MGSGLRSMFGTRRSAKKREKKVHWIREQRTILGKPRVIEYHEDASPEVRKALDAMLENAARDTDSKIIADITTIIGTNK